MGGTPSANLTTTFFGATGPDSSGAAGGNQSKTLLLSNLLPYSAAGKLPPLSLIMLTAGQSTDGTVERYWRWCQQFKSKCAGDSSHFSSPFAGTSARWRWYSCFCYCCCWWLWLYCRITNFKL